MAIVLSTPQCIVFDFTLEMVILFSLLIFREFISSISYIDKNPTDNMIENLKNLKFQMCTGQNSRFVSISDLTLI